MPRGVGEDGGSRAVGTGAGAHRVGVSPPRPPQGRTWVQPGAGCPSPRGQLRASGPRESSGPPACREHRSPGARADARGEAPGSTSCVMLCPPGPLPCHHLPGNLEQEPWLCPHPRGDACGLLTLCHLRRQRSCMWGARLPEFSVTDSCCLGPCEMPASLLWALSLSEGHRQLTGQDVCVCVL